MEEILNYLNNYFYSYALMTDVTFEEDGNSFTISKFKKNFYKGQYIKIEETTINDGIFKVISIRDNGDSITITTDATEFAEGNFRCFILALAVPRPVIKLKEAIEEFKTKNKPSVYTSESFGSYSRSWATNSKGAILTWKDVFKEDLNQYRCMFDDREGLEVIKWL